MSGVPPAAAEHVSLNQEGDELRRPGSRLAWGLLFLIAVALNGVHFWIGWRYPHYDWQAFYATGQAIRAGADWYAPSAGLMTLAPPLVALVFAGLTPLASGDAFLVWTVSGMAMYAVVLRVAGRRIGWSPWSLCVAAGCLAAMYSGIRLGQLHLFFGALVSAVWLLDRQGRSFSAGLLLGLATYTKPLVGLIGVYWAWRRDWVATLGWAITAGVLFGIGMVAFPEHTARWIAGVRALASQDGAGMNLSLVGVLRRADLAVLTVPAVVSILGALAWRIPAFTRDRAWAALLLSALLVSPIAWLHYLLIAVGPVAVLFRNATATERRCLLAGYAGLCLAPVFDDWARHPSPWIAGTLGSVYTWALCAWWIAAIHAGTNSEPQQEARRR